MTRREFVISVCIGGAVSAAGLQWRSKPSRPRRNPAVTETSQADGGLLLELSITGKGLHVYHLNPCAAAIWRACDGDHGDRDIADQLVTASGRSYADCLAAARLGLAQLDDHNLLSRGRYQRVVERRVGRGSHGVEPA